MQIFDSTQELLYDKNREAELMDILGIQSMDEITIIPWRPPTIRPDEASYVLVKFYDEGSGVTVMDLFGYENSTYTYYYCNGGSFDLPVSRVLGWAYPISFRNK